MRPSDYRTSHTAPGKGRSYHSEFTENPYRAMVWDFEREILDKVFADLYQGRDVEHMDFACGTGRILNHFSDRCASSVGVDVSPSMLEIARGNCRDSEILEADLTREDVLGNRKFDLITAFRFFPNAQPELRQQAMETLVRHLTDDGYLIFNNHKHTGSLRNRLARMIGRREFKGMSLQDVRKLLSKNHLEITRSYHLCVLPASEKNMLLPAFLLKKLEGLLARISILHNFGENLIIVCKHTRG